MNISCDLLNTVLKVKNRMVVRVSVVYPCDCMADQELLCPASQDSIMYISLG